MENMESKISMLEFQSKIGKNGVEKIIEINLSDEEKKQFEYSIKDGSGSFLKLQKKIDTNLT